MRSAENGHGNSFANGSSTNSGPHGPYALTIAGVPLNLPIPPVWDCCRAITA